jgi:hypothetical protein
MSHPADRLSVSGRDTPRPSGTVTHAVRITAAIITGRDSSIVQTGKAVLRFSCDACPGWQPWLDGEYLMDAIRDRVIIPHCTGDEAP